MAAFLAAGAALAGAGASRAQIDVTLLDGKMVVTPRSVTAGPVTLLVVNKGKAGHALAISGQGVGAKRTATLKTGASAKLSLTTSSGPYKLWDPVAGSLSRATVLTAHAAPASSTPSKPASSGGSVTKPASGSLSNNGTTTCAPGMNTDMPDTSQITACVNGTQN